MLAAADMTDVSLYSCFLQVKLKTYSCDVLSTSSRVSNICLCVIKTDTPTAEHVCQLILLSWLECTMGCKEAPCAPFSHILQSPGQSAICVLAGYTTVTLHRNRLWGYYPSTYACLSMMIHLQMQTKVLTLLMLALHMRLHQTQLMSI